MLRELLSVFTKEYKAETVYIDYMRRNINRFKLNDNSESIDDKIRRLDHFESNFHMKIDNFC